MTISTVQNPLTGKDMTMVKGTITGVFYNEIKEPKTYANDWTPTHRLNIKVDNDYIGFGMTDKPDNVDVKDEDGNWHPLVKGAEVSGIINVTKSACGKYTNNNLDNKSFRITKPAPANASTATGQAKGAYQKKEFNEDGMLTGHALNGAMNLLNGKVTNMEEYLELAKQVLQATLKVRERVKATTDIDDYSLKASVGNAILNVCTMLTKAKVDQLEDKTVSFFENAAVPMLAHVKGEPTKTEEEAPVAQDEEDELDDDIPF